MSHYPQPTQSLTENTGDRVLINAIAKYATRYVIWKCYAHKRNRAREEPILLISVLANSSPIIIACSVLCPHIFAVCFVLKTFDTEGSPCNLILTLHLERDFETEGISELLCPHSVLEHEFKRLDKWPTTLILLWCAGVAQWQSRSFPSLRREFDSPRPLQSLLYE